MAKIFHALLFALLGIAPLIYFVFRERRRRRKQSRSPFTDKLLRPAGESLRLKLEDINDKLSDALVQYFMTATFVPLTVLLAPPLKTATAFWTAATALILIELPFLLFYGRKFLKLRLDRSNYELGYQGERAVGEELNQLLAEGCRVYHDLPFEGKLGEAFNIDHVVLSPMGVFAVETKTRRKPNNITGKERSQITFNGRTAIMPWGENAFGLERAQRNSQSLSQWLTKSVGEKIFARPVLTFPGWFIKAEGKGEVSVLNPKQIRGLVVQNGHRPVLSEKLVDQIKYQLEQKCRNIHVD